MNRIIRKNDSSLRGAALASELSPPPRKSWIAVAGTLLFVRRRRWSLTWTGRVLAFAIVATLAVVLARGLCRFLAVTSPVGAPILVVEGWIPRYAYREAAAQFRQGRYRRVIVAEMLQEDADAAGDPREPFGREKLIKFGVPGDAVSTVPVEESDRDRTFHAAMAVKQWLEDQHLDTTSIDLITVGAHARRSRLLYEKALGSAKSVGIISIEDRRFDPDHWWRTSEGFRTTVSEAIAYLYARVVFSAPE
jgi:uncharacterized SAM-binding protein YcdF (DUF218 family)